MIEQTEVEIKIQLASRKDYEKVAAYLREPLHVVHQHNYFFDGTNKEILQSRGAFRMRFIITKTDEKCVLTFKPKTELQQGISTAQELEEEVDPTLAEQAMKDPNELLQWNGQLIGIIRDKYRMNGFVNLGGFKTLRKTYSWINNVQLELDETVYTFGTKYEIEIETNDPVPVKQELYRLLNELGVIYQDSKTTKFEDLVHECIAIVPHPHHVTNS
jgi:uncharacterized protein YjbK